MYTQLLNEVEQYGATLVAVSKTKPSSAIMDLYSRGQRHFGENRVQELVEKYELLPKDIHWHMIGNLQTNKVKYIIDFVYMIHSVDRLSLLKAIEKESEKKSKKTQILLQYKIAEEDTKSGADDAELDQMLDYIQSQTKWIQLCGVMGMATFTDDDMVVRKEFGRLRTKYAKIQKTIGQHEAITHLSMGMSGDYKIALEEGSNMVRIGSLLFGER